MWQCGICRLDFSEKQGIKLVISDKDDEILICNACLRQSMRRLSLKRNKHPDEIALLSNIRRYLKHEKDN